MVPGNREGTDRRRMESVVHQSFGDIFYAVNADSFLEADAVSKMQLVGNGARGITDI